MSTPLFFSFFVSLVVSMSLIPLLTTSAWRFQIIDMPGDRHAHVAPIAKVGGIAFAVATFVAVLWWAPKDEVILSSLAGGAVILLFGVWDDRADLHYGIKFLGQILAAAVVIGFAGLRLSSLPFMDEDIVLPDWIAIPVTLVVIVAVTNAVNLADGLDGLAGGLSFISFAAIAFLAYLADEVQLVFLTVAVLGGLLGFLRFNTYPARIFMGDAGSQFLGHYLAVAAILLISLNHPFYSPLLMLLLWGVPILDTVGVMGQRLLEGRSPFVGDRNHLHYKLLSMGFGHRQAVTAIYAVHGLMVCCAYLLRWQSDAVILAVYGAFAVPILSLFVLAKYRPVVQRPWNEKTDVSETREVNGWYSTLPGKSLGLAVLLFLVCAALWPVDVPVDLGYAAVGLSVLLVVGAYVIPSARPLVVRAGLYLGATFVIYLLEQPMSPEWSGLHERVNGFFIVLGILVMLTIRFGVKHRFEMTPLDYLMVCVVAAMSFWPDMRVGDVVLGILAAKMIVMFLAIELMLHTFAERLMQFGLISVGIMLILGLRAWL
ncbi:MAG: undecaprenyl/decaprenyl-phosphate alpha-N-acetylglucosaminyl 1-phosphate transferase [Nitrospira sp.]|nr:undecaprenyl/decaprenyl-phosphate alpha-N-acetylglucosaminyl 1-phosphate transferase [Nitrospira sp.]MCP9442330.1 undecaprenyl/decaprenyl-phosphate alpha-N-acetylglucosaminyl 1-phosphate transferase [Nitrospira sp.]